MSVRSLARRSLLGLACVVVLCLVLAGGVPLGASSAGTVGLRRSVEQLSAQVRALESTAGRAPAPSRSRARRGGVAQLRADVADLERRVRVLERGYDVPRVRRDVEAVLAAGPPGSAARLRARAVQLRPRVVALRRFVATTPVAPVAPTPSAGPAGSGPVDTGSPGVPGVPPGAADPTDPSSPSGPSTPADPAPDLPTASSAGVPSGWVPLRTVRGPLTVTTPGAVVEDLRVEGDLVIAATGVVVRRVEVVGGSIDNFRGARCAGGLVVEDTSILRDGETTDDGTPALGAGGYTARNVLVDGPAEGFRVGGAASGCGPVEITGSYARVVAPDLCADWHGDGVQGYGGAALTVRSTVLELVERSGCAGTAAFFWPGDQGNGSVDVDGLLVLGGGYPFRLGTPGRVTGLAVAEGWGYAPVEVTTCSQVVPWQARVVRLDVTGQPVTVRDLPCG